MAKKGNIKSRSRRREREGRPERWKKYNQFFLIVCEDTKTEPAYFDQFKILFPINTLYLKSVGTGLDQLGVVEAAIEYRDKLAEETLKEIDFTWAVFDKDNADRNSKTIQRFNTAYSLAKEKNIKIALSNEAFELWLLLHFINIQYDSPIGREDLYAKLEAVFQKYKSGYKYIHGKPEVLEIVSKNGNEKKAIQRAKEVFDHISNREPISRNPSTEVYKLVMELRDWISFYNN